MNRRVLMAAGAVAAIVVVVLGVRLGSNQAAKSGLDRALATLPPGWTASHGAVAYDALSGAARMLDFTLRHGEAPVLSAATVEASGLGEAGPDGAPKRVAHLVLTDVAGGIYRHIKRVELSGLALADLRDVLDPAAYPGGHAAWTERRPLLDRVELTGVEAVLPGSQPVVVRWKKETVEDVAGHPFPLAPTPEGRALPAFWPGVVDSLAAGRETAEGIEGELPQAGHVGVGSEEVTHIEGGHVGSVKLRDMSVSAPLPQGAAAGIPGVVQIGHITVSDIDLSRMLVHLPELIGDPTKPHPAALQGIRAGEADLGDLSVTLPNADAPHVTMAALRVDTSWAADDGATTRLTMHGLAVDFRGVTLKPEAAENLRQFGMDDFVVDVDLAGGNDPHTTRSVIDHYDISVHDLGTLHITGSITGFTNAGTDAAAAERMIDDLVLERAAIRWDDASLTRRLFGLAALRAHTTPEELRQKLAIPLATLGFMLPDQPDAGDQVNAFLTGQHSLSITMSPPKPVSIADLKAAPTEEKARLLGIHIAGN